MKQYSSRHETHPYYFVLLFRLDERLISKGNEET